MRRDRDLITRILEYVEQQESLPHFEDVEQETVNKHLAIVTQENYVAGITVHRPLGDHPLLVHVMRRPELTPKGHQYLEDMRNNTVAKRVAAFLGQHIMAIAVAVITAVVLLILGLG